MPDALPSVHNIGACPRPQKNNKKALIPLSLYLSLVWDRALEPNRDESFLLPWYHPNCLSFISRYRGTAHTNCVQRDNPEQKAGPARRYSKVCLSNPPYLERKTTFWLYLRVGATHLILLVLASSIDIQSIDRASIDFLRLAAYEGVLRWYCPSDLSPTNRIAVGYQPHTMFDQRGAMLFIFIFLS